MLILALRTDKPEAELYLYEDDNKLAEVTWQAHRQLAETLHLQIRDILLANCQELKDIQGLAVYKGPGSFTGLRIGLSVANALASSLGAPIVGKEGEDWLKESLKALSNDENYKIVVPEYGAPVHITQQKK